MTQTNVICPFLGLAGDRTTTRTQADTSHRCYAQEPPHRPDMGYQATFCFAAGHADCPFFVAPAAAPAVQISTPAKRRTAFGAGWLRYLPWAALGLLLVIVAAVYIGDLRRPRAGAPATPPATAPAATQTPIAPSPAAPTAALSTERTPAGNTATPEPGGRIVTLMPKTGEVGWWSSDEARGSYLGDSYLYAGQIGGRIFISAARIELAAIPRGAPIRSASVRLTGLEGKRFNAAAGGAWSVQLLAADAVKDYARSNFQALFDAPASAVLAPTFYPADLAPGRVNEATLDAAARDWLARQVAGGADAVIVRIVGPTSGDDTLFAWDSGGGPATADEGIALTLVIGPQAATPAPSAP